MVHRCEMLRPHRAVARWGLGGGLQPPNFWQISEPYLNQGWGGVGQIMATTVLPAPPDFQTLRRACHRKVWKYRGGGRLLMCVVVSILTLPHCTGWDRVNGSGEGAMPPGLTALYGRGRGPIIVKLLWYHLWLAPKYTLVSKAQCHNCRPTFYFVSVANSNWNLSRHVLL